jgi:hypothetical protein
MKIPKAIAGCCVILSFFLGLLMPHVSLSGDSPDVSPPWCVSCGPGYHCGHNPERCIPDKPQTGNRPNPDTDSHTSKGPTSTFVKSVGLGAISGGVAAALDQKPKLIATAFLVGLFTPILVKVTTPADKSKSFIPEPEHYALAAQCLHSAPVLAFSVPLSDGREFSAMIAMSTDWHFSDARVVREKPEKQTGNAAAVIFTYAF